VEKYLQMFINHQQDNWSEWLPLAKLSYNNAINEAMGYSPFYLKKGQHPYALPTNSVMEPGMAAEKYLKVIQEMSKKAEACLVKTKAAMKWWWDKWKGTAETFHPGDQVLISADQLLSDHPSQKLDDKSHGPFKVLVKRGLWPMNWSYHLGGKGTMYSMKED
jgi:hypothetical protein